MSGQIDSERDRKLGGLSCAECRRSKAKCDRIFPCQSCVRRGCGNICPDGTLAPTKGNTLLVGQIQRLGNQVKSAQARVEELQERLRTTSAGDSHVLLQEDTPAEPAYDLQLYNNDSDLSAAMGSLLIDPDGNAKYHGESAGSEFLIALIESKNEDTASVPDLSLISRQLGPAIADLSKAFPMGLAVCHYTISEFAYFVPDRSRALELVEMYYKRAAVVIPIERCDLMKTIIEPLYGGSQVASLANIHAHRLAIFFAIFASAAYYDRSPYSDILAKQYHVLARAALSLETIIRVGSTATLQALLTIIWFMRVSDSQSHQERWLLGGTCVRLAQIIGLQRDNVSWTLDEEENQRRRVLFWELYTVEATSSCMMGLPPGFILRHTDCQFPIDTEPHINSQGNSESGYHDWKRRYAASYMSIAMQFVCSAKAEPYEDIVKLEERLRHAPTPHYLQSPVEPSDTNSSWSLDPMTAYQQYLVIAFRENTILYIHKNYFAQAVREEPLDPFQHKLAPSVRAAYKSATHLVSGMRGLHEAHPQVAHDQWWLWTSLFSACIILGALVVEAPRCAVARDAMLRLEQAVHLFEIGLDLFHAPPMLDTLQRLLTRSKRTMNEVYEPHAFQRSQSTPGPDSMGSEELAILVGGRKSLIKTKLPAKSPSHTHQHSISPSSSQSMSPLPDGSTTLSAVFDPVMNFSFLPDVSSTDRNYEFTTHPLDGNYQYGYGPSNFPPMIEHDRGPQYGFMQDYPIPTPHETSQFNIWDSFVEELMAPPG